MKNRVACDLFNIALSKKEMERDESGGEIRAAGESRRDLRKNVSRSKTKERGKRRYYVLAV